jgi:3-hydroxyisobutyrate dehydrogenase-like beta-hydroxyacid dehydrogenase
MSSVVVVGIGAMGGGMARALLDSAAASTVIGVDKNEAALNLFHQESVALRKNRKDSAPSSLKEAVSPPVEFVILSLVNESQCESVCFGEDDCLCDILEEGSCVILTSTVTGTSNQNV